MIAKKLPHTTTPCNQCPFRKDTLRGWLGSERVEEILNQQSFVCHKTIDGTTSQRRQCAGHMMLAKNNEFVGLANAMGIDLNPQGREVVFDTVEDCVRHHGND